MARMDEIMTGLSKAAITPAAIVSNIETVQQQAAHLDARCQQLTEQSAALSRQAPSTTLSRHNSMHFAILLWKLAVPKSCSILWRLRRHTYPSCHLSPEQSISDVLFMLQWRISMPTIPACPWPQGMLHGAKSMFLSYGGQLLG